MNPSDAIEVGKWLSDCRKRAEKDFDPLEMAAKIKKTASS